MTDIRDRDCDVLVIGAGPAGSAAALAAASAGAEVIIMDRRQSIGARAHCAGFIPAPAISAARPPEGVVIQSVATMSIHTPDGGELELPSPGFMVDRERFDQTLAAWACLAGACLLTETRAVSHGSGRTTFTSSKGEGRIRPAIVIGADGPRSVAGGWSGAVNTCLLVGAQYTMPLAQPSDHLHVFFHQQLPGGYGWVFPRGTTANVGVGVRMSGGVKPAQALKWFVEKVIRQGYVGSGRLSATGGLIPVGGPVFSRTSHMILAGDAGGLCHPLTGAGISLALQSGKLAGEFASAAAMGGGSAVLSRYADEITELVGPALRNAVRRRQYLYEREDAGLNDFSRAVRESWTGSLYCERH
ncbi:MAG: geranylgeranyl reductase family protein [Thermoleophilia bacterium]